MIRKELVIAFCLIIFAAIAFAPFILVALGHYSGGILQRFNQLLDEYTETIIALGTIFLVSALAIWTSHLSNVSAEKRESANRKVQIEMKIAEFRQIWIDELRSELVRFVTLASQYDSKTDNSEMFQLMSKISMRLNGNEGLVKDTVDNMKKVVAALDATNKRANIDNIAELLKSGKAYLKWEWDRLKDDLRNDQILDGDEL